MKSPRLLAAIGTLCFVLGLGQTALAATARLTWSANTEPDLAGYIAYWDTTSHASSGTYAQQVDVGNVTTYDVTGLADGTTYYFAVRAYDGTGNLSALSAEVSLTTPGGGGDTTPPDVVSVSTTSATTVVVAFSEAVDPTSAETAANYSIDGGTVAVLDAILAQDGITVRLTTDVQNPDDFHTLAVSGVADLATPPNAASTQVSYQVSLGLQVSVVAPAGYDVFPVAVGDDYYVDRTYTVDQIPAAYQDAQWVRTANDDKSSTAVDLLTFSVDQDALVFVGYDKRATSVPDWLSGAFVPTGEGPVTTDTQATPFAMWGRDVAAGDVVLGGNAAAGAAGAAANYVVLVLPMPGPTASDADGDGMPDTWEDSMGLDSGLFDAHDDPDGDGMTNLQEYWVGTNPLVSDAGSGGTNQAPTLSLDGSVVGIVGQTISLDGTGATDPDGDPLIWQWRQASGTTVTLVNADQPTASFTPQQTGVYGFTLTVRDGNGGIAASTIYAEVAEDILMSTVTDLGANLLVSTGSLTGAMLSIPNGAMTKTYEVSIGTRDLPKALPAGRAVTSEVIHFSPSGVQLLGDATIRLPYTPPASGPVTLLRYDADTDAWVTVPVGQTLGATVEAYTDVLGTFVVTKASGSGGSGGATASAGGGGCTATGSGTGPGDIAGLLTLIAFAMLRVGRKTGGLARLARLAARVAHFRPR